MKAKPPSKPKNPSSSSSRRTPKTIRVLIHHSQNSSLADLPVNGVQGHLALCTQCSDRGGHQVPRGHSQVSLFLGQHLQPHAVELARPHTCPPPPRYSTHLHSLVHLFLQRRNHQRPR
nr:hypothetical protein CFP56_74658 [Quercus suber]